MGRTTARVETAPDGRAYLTPDTRQGKDLDKVCSDAGLRRLKIAASALLLLVIPVLSAIAVAADNPAEDSATAQFLQAPSIASVDFSSDGNRTPVSLCC